MTILDEIEAGPGYYIDALTASELDAVREMINTQYLERVGQLQPALVPLARERGIARYHSLPIQFDHGNSWSKSVRLLAARHVKDFSRMRFFRHIREQIGPSAVISHDELNWRLVRPKQPADVGPIHADKWFWDAGYGYGSMPPGFDRFKVWMAIHTEPGANGLCIKPDSYRRDWKHHFEEKAGARKPVFDEDPDSLGMELLPLAAGGLVMFHDKLLHGGVVNQGTTCRVSLELTVLFDRAEATRRAGQLRGELAAA